MSLRDKEGRINPAFVGDPEQKDLEMQNNNLKKGSVGGEGVIAKGGSGGTPDMTYGPKESRRMMLNCLLISLSFTFLFTAFQSMAALQNSLNSVSVSNAKIIFVKI